MTLTSEKETAPVRKFGMGLQEFCDVEQLYKLLSNWSKSCGMATVIIDTNGNKITEDFGITEFCKTIQSCEKGLECCRKTWKSDLDGIYECPFGFLDFSIPIILPNGQVLGKVLAGQALSVNQKEEEIMQRTSECGIDEELIKNVLPRVCRKTDTEMQGAYDLLKETLHFFIEKSYYAWETNNELKKAPEKKDRVLSQITRIMYSYNLTVDIATGDYSLITGTGMERTVEEYKRHSNMSEIKAFQESIIHHSYLNRFIKMVDFESSKNDPTENGYRGTLEYPVLYPGDDEYEWHEINVFIDTEEDGRRIANILGRDITAAHNAQEKNEKELRAAADKNRILSELTKKLYSYNLTLNLRTGKYSMIIGTGMTQFMEIFKSTDDYETAYNKKLKYLDPENVPQFEALASLDALRARTNANGFIGNLEYGTITDYSEEWHEINVFISTDEDGEPVANILGKDITDAHKRHEKRENQQQEAKERELKASAAKDQILSDITKTLYSYNATVNLNTGKYSLIVGTGMEELIRHFSQTDDFEAACGYLLEKVLPEYREDMNNKFSLEALRKQQNLRGHIGQKEYAAITENGLGWFEVNAFMGVDEDGNPTANILGREITETHEAQERRENELKAVAARDQLLSGVTKMLYSYNMTVNVDTGKYTLITGTGLDDTVARMEATDNYEDIYQSFMKAVDPEQLKKGEEIMSLDNYMGRQDKTGHLGTEEFLMHYTEKPEWHEINVFAGYDENGEAIINILGRDVTEAHDKADTKAQLEIANASSAAKSAFLFNMSHDIRTPMNAIIGFTELLDKHLDNKELARGYIKKIQTSNEFLLSLINNVLEMARIESGKTTLDETCWNAYVFNDTIHTLFSSQMKEKGIEFTRTIDVEHTEVICDATKLREIFLNILSNALKYTPAGGKVTMRLKEIPSDRPGYAMYRTEIEDTGIGMSEDFLPHMFDEFTRERSSTESRVSGTGLGMAIVKKLVDFLDGTIKVESQIGKGTKFTVTLPHRIAANSDNIQHIDNNSDIDTEKFKGKRILLAEDNELNAEIAVTILKEAGFSVEHAEDGIICVDMLEKAEPNYYDLVLMDIQMPNMDGYKATQTIRQFSDKGKASIPVIAMTANAFEEDKQNAYRAGMNGHIAKPINVNELMATLGRLL